MKLAHQRKKPSTREERRFGLKESQRGLKLEGRAHREGVIALFTTEVRVVIEVAMEAISEFRAVPSTEVKRIAIASLRLLVEVGTTSAHVSRSLHLD